MSEELLKNIDQENIVEEETIIKERYYYTDGKNYYNYKQPVNDENFIEITEEEFNQHNPELKIFSTPTQEQIARRTKLNRIRELKNNLSQTDYQAIKYAEGVLSAEDYEEIKQQRQSWRNEINELEGEK